MAAADVKPSDTAVFEAKRAFVKRLLLRTHKDGQGFPQLDVSSVPYFYMPCGLTFGARLRFDNAGSDDSDDDDESSIAKLQLFVVWRQAHQTPDCSTSVSLKACLRHGWTEGPSDWPSRHYAFSTSFQPCMIHSPNDETVNSIMRVADELRDGQLAERRRVRARLVGSETRRGKVGNLTPHAPYLLSLDEAERVVADVAVVFGLAIDLAGDTGDTPVSARGRHTRADPYLVARVEPVAFEVHLARERGDCPGGGSRQKQPPRNNAFSPYRAGAFEGFNG
jgi:hypothetical protein